ncbi:MAG: histidine phosphatase family protein [Gemmatimonadales bacterium]|nr:MAG: histidine phosphatase family protein [Gemmatimonadales bacterium]
MKTIHLLRHAKSSWADPDLADRDRPLALRGRKAVRAMAAHFGGREVLPDLVLCSPARRTRETLDGISESLGGAWVEIDEGLYGADARGILHRIQRLPPTSDSVLIIGHNPALEEVAELLLAPGGHDASLDRMQEKYPTGALATFVAPGAWREVGEGTCVLRSFIRPRDLE